MTAGTRDFEHDPGVPATVTGMMAQRELVAGELVAGRFRILRILGMGGMGLVYQAHDIELDIDVALKLLRPELASRPDAFERFRKELLLARQVSSPHVVRIHDLVRHDQAWLISMDFVAGQSLERLLSEQRTLPPERALDITRQLALGLAAAHRSQVIHRDLKPANVMVDEDGEVRITDFGVARTAGETGITGSGVVIGTPEYLSPEQARAEPLDARSDLYALGLILYEMLTGTLPFPRGNSCRNAGAANRSRPTAGRHDQPRASAIRGQAVRLAARAARRPPDTLGRGRRAGHREWQADRPAARALARHTMGRTCVRARNDQRGDLVLAAAIEVADRGNTPGGARRRPTRPAAPAVGE